MGVINQSTGSFGTVVSSLSTIVYSFDSISVYAANVERLSKFYQAMADADEIKREHWSQSKRHHHLLRIATSTDILFESKDRETDCDENEISSTTSKVTTSCDIEMAVKRQTSFEEIHLNKSKITDNGDDYEGNIDLQLWTDNTPYVDMSTEARNVVLQIDHLDLYTPDRKRVLIHDLNVKVQYGQHMLIVGASGVGKSSLLRAIAGLWTTGRGVIARPENRDVYFLPQQPYCTMGSLKDQLLYPTSPQNSEQFDPMMDWSFRSVECMNDSPTQSYPQSSDTNDDDLIKILTRIHLLDVATRAGDGDPVKGLDTIMDWSNVLSLGEQQRLAFGRLLVNRPRRLVVLDEATSALDLYNEKSMYGILREMADTSVGNGVAGLTYISVGHRPSLAEYHTVRLDLGGNCEVEASVPR
jgi:ABC-type uncharacterized transport system fused permease/ATPase subunit